MVDPELLKSIASQLMTNNSVTIGGDSLPVGRTSAQRLRTVAFNIEGHQYQAIEQNPEKPSRWGQRARSSQKVVHFTDTERNKFIAVAVDGKVTITVPAITESSLVLNAPKREIDPRLNDTWFFLHLVFEVFSGSHLP